MEHIENTFMLLILVSWVIYCLWYVFNERRYGLIFRTVKDIFVNTYKYSLNLLTTMFLIIYYSEMIIRFSGIDNFSIAIYLEKKTVSIFEIIVVILVCILIVGALIIWTNKVLRLAGNNIMKIQFRNEAVTITMRLICSIVFLIFHVSILLPLFSYGLAGTFGNPRL